MTPKSRHDTALRLFWHSTRKEWVPRTVSEMEDRANATQGVRAELAREGLILLSQKAEGGLPGSAIYRITEAGQKALAPILAAEQAKKAANPGAGAAKRFFPGAGSRGVKRGVSGALAAS